MATNDLSRSVDPITFEILSHRLHQLAKETGITLERVGGTVNTTQMKDYAAALYRANGEILSAGETTGWHVACAGVAVKRIIERFGDTGEIEASTIHTWRQSINPISTCSVPSIIARSSSAGVGLSCM